MKNSLCCMLSYLLSLLLLSADFYGAFDGHANKENVSRNIINTPIDRKGGGDQNHVFVRKLNTNFFLSIYSFFSDNVFVFAFDKFI